MQNRNSGTNTKTNESMHPCIRLSPYKKWTSSPDNDSRYTKCPICNMDAKTISTPQSVHCSNHPTKDELKTDSPSKIYNPELRSRIGTMMSPPKSPYKVSFLKNGSTSPEPGYLQPITRSPNGIDPNHSTFRKMLDATTQSPIKTYQRTEPSSPNIKCGNSSCNGSEPLKETHITTQQIENRYREEVELLRGKIRELSKKAEKPPANTKKSPKCRIYSNSPKRADILIEINSDNTQQSPVYIAKNGVKKLFVETENGKVELANGRVNGEVKEVAKGEKKIQNGKVRRKACTESSESESEISDSECSEPEDVEERQTNYDSMLSELATLKNNLNLSYNPTHPESGDTSISFNKHSSVLRPSLFPYVPPYLKFFPHDQSGPKLPSSIQKTLRWQLSNITPVIVRKTLINSGFRLIRSEIPPGSDVIDPSDWIGTWGKHIKSPVFRQLRENQKINHFPGTFQLGRKDRLWRNTQKLQIKYGLKEFDYVPKTYILPQDLKQLRHVWEKGEGETKWILKPPASARGAGIRVVSRWNQVPKKKPLVVQRYIENPYLINGSKFDLRLYVLMTSFDPMRIYLYPDGLARFASVKYSSDCSTLDNRYMHLTNYSINKLSRDYTANEDAGACQGHKWTIQALWEYLSKNGVDTVKLWKSLEDLVIKTIISGESGITQLLRGNVNSRYNCYELFGVDVLLDENLKPWLLEVNISPSLHSTSPLDLFVKGPLVQTLLNMAQYHIPTDSFTSQQRQHIIKNLCVPKNRFAKSPSPEIKSGKKSPAHNGEGENDGDEEIPLSFDPRIYTVQLTQREKLKQIEMVTHQDRSEYLNEILTNLTPDDVRHLLIAEDELQVCGKFQKIFPTKDSHRYLPLMETRYYDRLFDAWEHKYSSNRKSGIILLQAYCAKKYHLIIPPPAKIFKENMTPTKPNQEESSPMTTSPTTVAETPNPSTQGATEGPSPSRKPRICLGRRRFNRVGLLTIKHYPRAKYISTIAYPRMINRRMQQPRTRQNSETSSS